MAGQPDFTKVKAALARLRQADTRTVRDVVRAYLKQAPRELCARRLRNVSRTLGILDRELGGKKVCDCSPTDLSLWVEAHPEWRSAWARHDAHAAARRAFNWAVRMKVVKENPFAGARSGRGAVGRDVTGEEFRRLLRGADACFRRVLLFLRWTGCRPGELSAMRWCHLDWERQVVTLPPELHKTGRATNAPRQIVLEDRALRLLAWLGAHQRDGTSAALLASVLADGPVPKKELVRRAKALGLTPRMLWLARRRLGVRQRRVRLGKGYATVYQLPQGAEGLPRLGPGGQGYVFLNGHGRPWDKSSLDWRFYRLRRKLGLPMDCRLYGLRHAFGTAGAKSYRTKLRRCAGPLARSVSEGTACNPPRSRFGLGSSVLSGSSKAGVDLKTLSTLMGHAGSRTTEHYVHVEGDLEHLAEAARKVAEGETS